MRTDILGILLHMANVGAGAKILTLENSGGLVTGAVAERLGGHGAVVSTYLSPRAPSIDVVKAFNFTPEVKATIRQESLLQLLKTRQAQEQLQVSTEEQAEAQAGAGADGAGDAAEPMDTTAIDLESNEAAPAAPLETAAATATAIISSATVGGGPPFTGCIISGCPIHPTTALQTIFPLLAPSATFAVASLHLQPLAEAMYAFRTNGTAVNMSVQDTWYREQQVLPGRTHPTMNTNHGGGYLLSGTVTVTGTQVPLALPALKEEANAV